jgi:hypothetical protein
MDFRARVDSQQQRQRDWHLTVFQFLMYQRSLCFSNAVWFHRDSLRLQK